MPMSGHDQYGHYGEIGATVRTFSQIQKVHHSTQLRFVRFCSGLLDLQVFASAYQLSLAVLHEVVQMIEDNVSSL
jgi:arginine decarboxylase-like protein